MLNKKAAGWLIPLTQNKAPALRLFCFPYAGGGASVFRNWKNFLPQEIEAYALQAPGRETRFSEPPISEMQALVKLAAEAIKPYTDKPFALFGHSLGSTIAFETARLLQAEGIDPGLVIISGRQCPGAPSKRSPIGHLPEKEFLKGLEGYNGTPKEVLQNKDLIELLLPMIRADFLLSENYQHHQPSDLLRCPILGLGSKQDFWLDPVYLERWSQFTSGTFESQWFEGDHFYLNHHTEDLVKTVSEKLQFLCNKPIMSETLSY